MVVYYSGTGNSRYCAQLLADRLGDGLVDAFEYLKHRTAAELASGSPWVFVCPTYAWRIPRIFEEFIRTSCFSGSKEAYFVMTCGGEIGNAGAYLETLCKDTDMDYRGVLEVLMPENYVAMFPVPGDEEAGRIVEKAVPVLEQGASCIAAGKKLPPHRATITGRLKSTVVNPIFYPLIVKDRKFYATEQCISCGKCAEVCVLNNVKLEEGKPKWQGNCTHCMACICSCPKEAIEYGKASQGKPRYQCRSWKKQ